MRPKLHYQTAKTRDDRSHRPPSIGSSGCGSRQLGKWRLADKLGEGRLSEVFLAAPKDADAISTFDYAIKVLRPEFHNEVDNCLRLQREALIGSTVSHPHLVAVLSAHVKQPPYFVVTPRLQGATVAQVLRDVGAFVFPHALWVARQVAGALSALHASGWVHADVKPDNVIVHHGGHATLFDLDLAMPLESTPLRGSAMCGTLAYTAPELFTRTGGPSPASDVYGLGVSLFEMLTCRKPFEDPRPERMVECHLQQVPPSLRTFLPSLPQGVSRFVGRMLAKDPARRPSSSGELQTGLARLELETFAMRTGLNCQRAKAARSAS